MVWDSNSIRFFNDNAAIQAWEVVGLACLHCMIRQRGETGKPYGNPFATVWVKTGPL